MWTIIGKGETTYFFNDVAYIKVHEGFYYLGNTAHVHRQVKMVFQNDDELNLPSEHSLASCMEYANIYKDFLELKAPIKG